MKLILLLITAAILNAATLRAADQSLAADDLAYHLGIRAWETTVTLPPGSFQVQVLHIVEGKIGGELVTGFGLKNDVEGQRLVVIAGPSPTGTKATLQIGSSGAAMNPKEQTSEIYFQSKEPLPKEIGAGKYLLGGEYRKGEKVTNITGKVGDVKNGVLLEVVVR